MTEGGKGVSINIPEDVTRDAAGFLQRLLGPAAEAADILSDKIRFYRWQSSIRILKRAKQIAEDEGLQPSQTPLKFLVPFLEKASLEEEASDLVDNWARLLLSGGSGDATQKIMFVDILSKLSGYDVKFLKGLWEKADPEFFSGPGSYYHAYGFDYLVENKIKSDSLIGQASLHFFDQGSEKFGRSLLRMEGSAASMERAFRDINEAKKIWARGFGEQEPKFLKSIMCLQHEGLVQVKSFKGKQGQQEYFVIWYELTPFGYDFVSACEAKKK